MTVQRTVRVVQASANIADGTSGTLDFLHPTSGVTAFRGGVKTLGINPNAPEGGADSLPPSQANDEPITLLDDLGGYVSCAFYGNYLDADADLTGVWLIDRDGNVVETIFDNTGGGLAIGDATPAQTPLVTEMLRHLRVENSQGLRVRVANGTGGPIGATVDAGGARAEFHLGINADVADVNPTL